MTLSRFLRDYLYIPLGGNRHGPARRYVNLMATMLLGGLWHGAGWTFVLWGGLHGAYLVVNHLWREARSRLGLQGGLPNRLGVLAAWSLTFLAVTVAWVPFKADTLSQAGMVLVGMAGRNGLAMPPPLDEGSVALAWTWILPLLSAVWLAPNTQEIMARHLPQMQGLAGAGGWLSWRPATSYAVVAAVVAVLALGHLSNVSEFLYFQF